ncbi:DUF805 domain-containing protein [Streptococcus pneumoniae]
MFKAYKKFWMQYVDFAGKSSRSDYWWVVLCNILIMAPFMIYIISKFLIFAVEPLTGTAYGGSAAVSPTLFSGLSSLLFVLIVVGLYSLAILIPSYAIMVRRLRDAGFHWGFIFLHLGPAILSWVHFEDNGLIFLLSLVLNIVLIVLLCMPTKDDTKPVPVTSYRVIDEQNLENSTPAVPPVVESWEMDEDK